MKYLDFRVGLSIKLLLHESENEILTLLRSVLELQKYTYLSIYLFSK